METNSNNTLIFVLISASVILYSKITHNYPSLSSGVRVFLTPPFSFFSSLFLSSPLSSLQLQMGEGREREREEGREKRRRPAKVGAAPFLTCLVENAAFQLWQLFPHCRPSAKRTELPYRPTKSRHGAVVFQCLEMLFQEHLTFQLFVTTRNATWQE